MKAKTVLAIGLACVIGTAHAEDAAPASDPELDKLKNQLAELTASNGILAARFGAAATPKSGAVAGLDKLSGMANQHLPLATRQVGDAIGRQLTFEGCNRTAIVSSQGITDKVGQAISFTKQIEQLTSELQAAGALRNSNAQFAIQLAPIAVVGAAVSAIGLFKSDYEVANSTLDVDEDWLVASMLRANLNVTGERFPDRTAVDALVEKVEKLKNDANGLPDADKDKKKKKKELIGKVAKLEAALLKPDDKGMIPLVTTAFYQSMTGKDGTCLAILTNTGASPMLLSKDTIWGKGGRAFLYMPVQASVVVITNKGIPARLLCKVSTVSAAIKLSSLTTTNGTPEVPWAGKLAKAADDCGGKETFAEAVALTEPTAEKSLDVANPEGTDGPPTIHTLR